MNKKIIKCLSEVLSKDISVIEKLDPNVPLSDIDFTSIALVHFVVRIEEELKIEILDSDLLYENFSTLNNILKTLSKYIDHKNPIIKKCLILDADNVLWKGISGEEDIVIDDVILNFQNTLLELYRRGVILCLCSKNSIKEIKTSFAHPKMMLNEEHFAALRANSFDKVTNIISIAKELNIFYDSMVFADDSDYELGFVSLNLPEITTLKINHTTLKPSDTLMLLFDAVQASSDLNRTVLYQEQKNREKEKLHFTTIEEYNQSLETQISCHIATPNEISRLSELSFRTHQFNLSARSYTDEELSNLMNDDRISVFSLSAKDKYGDMGIVGMAILNFDTIEAFMISCRVFDRDFELRLLEKIKETIPTVLYGIYVSNEKNSRFADFYSKNGVTQI